MKLTRSALVIPAFVLTALAAVAAAQENAWISHGPTGVGVVYDVAVADSVAYAATPNGVFRSDDGGASWQQSGLAGESIVEVLVPSGAAAVLARGGSGILYASRDGAHFWARVPALSTVSVAAIDPGQPSTVYAGLADATIWKSADAGSSWHRLSTTPTGTAALSMAFAANAIYILSYDDSDERYEFYRSTDGGVSWTVFQTPSREVSVFGGSASSEVVYAAGLNVFCRSADSAATFTCSSFPGYPTRIVEVPGDGSGAPPRILAAAPGGVSVSRDGGATWSSVDVEVSTGYSPALASDPSGSLLLAGTVTGILRSQDRGDSWTPANAGLRSSEIGAIAVDPQDASTVWAGNGFEGKIFRSADAGLSWSLADGRVDGFSALVVDPRHSSTLYAAGVTVSRSDNGGESWTSFKSPGAPSITALAVDPNSPQRVWEASYGGLFRSDDGARSWTSTPAVAQEVYSILFDAKKPGTMYAGSYYDVEPGFYGYPRGGSIFASYDGGANWAKQAHDFGSQVVAIATDPFQDGGLYAATLSAGVFRSADRGSTWQGPGLGLPPSPSTLSSLVADPVRADRLYAATDSGVYRTTDGAQTWQPFSSGLGSLQTQTRSLVIAPDGKWLHAGTIGGGVFELDLEPSQTCSPTETRLCLVGNRYAVELLAARPGETPNQPGAAQPLSDRSGFFALPFATGDPALPEVAVKMLADGTFGGNGAPFFYASLTTLPFVLTVTDRATGLVEVYASNPDAPLCGGTSLSFGPASPWDYRSTVSAHPLSAPAAGEALQLLGGRFSVTLEARDTRYGRTASGVAMLSGDRFGIFSLPGFTGDPDFPEVVVKMVDARGFATGSFWFFFTGLTGLDYTLTVTDSVTGAVRTYVGATPFCGTADTEAFTDSPPNPSGIDLNGVRTGSSRSDEHTELDLSR